jgi:3-deoxy-7-phosphoheptulonate synthase
VATSPEGHRYEPIATEIQRAVKFVRASHTDPREDWLLGADLWTSHEALLLPYEEALVRRDQESGEWFGSSGHLLWVGERTRAVDGAHVEFLSGLENPVACKLGPTATADEVVSLCERLNPDRIPGRLTLISRMGATQVTEALPPLLAATRDEAHPVIWAVDPMHGNTLETSSGRKTRRFDDIIEEVQGFFAACASESTWPGGLHVELTGEDVTECLGGSEDLSEADLDICYTTTCDPRLNARQALDLAFRVAELLRIGMQP